MGDEEPRLTGSVIANKYRIDAELGRGGMGAVYRVTHLQVRKEFALKILHKRLASKRDSAVRFLKEAQAAGRIGHPAILDVYDVGEAEDGTNFMVMELLRGESLDALLESGPLSVDQATWVATEMLAALAAAHRVGIVHRDVKPQNVFLTNGTDGRRAVKLLDFGVAKFQATSDESALTRTGAIVGSPLYMAPEQAMAEDEIDARVDVWSTGATLFEMLTGRAAHSGASPVAVLARVVTEPAPRVSFRLPEVDSELDDIVERALKIRRDERYASAQEMQEALVALRQRLGWGETPPPTFPPRRVTPAPADLAPTIAVLESDRGGSSDFGVATDDVLLGAAVTKSGRPHGSQRLPLAWRLALVALVVLGVGVIVPLLLPGRGWNATTPDPSAAAAPSAAPATRPAANVTAAPREVPSPRAASTPSAAPTPSAAATSSAVAQTLLVSGKRGAPRGERTPPFASRPTCAPGEVLSFGHCCPNGFVWQRDRCERPLATSF